MSTRVIGLLSLMVATGCGHDIIDDWGHRSGYGSVAGVVRDAAGTAQPSILVAVSICESPIVGFLGEAGTDGQGRFRIDGTLPPVGAVGSSFNADTLRVKCELFVGPRGAALVRDTVTVPFFRLQNAVRPVQRDVTLP